jgi:hypothetical protein
MFSQLFTTQASVHYQNKGSGTAKPLLALLAKGLMLLD